MSLHKKTLHPALKYSIFKVEHFLSELAQFQAHSHVDERGRERRGVVMWECSEYYASQEVAAGCGAQAGAGSGGGAATGGGGGLGGHTHTPHSQISTSAAAILN